MYMRLQSDNPSALYEVLKATLVGQYDLTETDFDAWVDSLESDEAYTSFSKRVAYELRDSTSNGPINRELQEGIEQSRKNQAKKPTGK